MTYRTICNDRPSHAKRAPILVGLVLCWPTLTMAQSALPAGPHQTWRCTSPSGLVTYSQQPCQGQAELKEMADERNLAQLRQARNNNVRDVSLARQMQRDRRHAERLASLEKPIALSSNKPHVIKASVNDHRPKPITDSTRPVKLHSEKKTSRRADSLATPGTPIRP